MSEPKEPNQTCPTIDKGISEIDSAIRDLEYSKSIYEEVRRANKDLRDWGQYWKDKCEEKDKEIKTLEEKIEELEANANN